MQSLLAIATVCGTTGAQAATCPAPRLATQAAVKQYIVASEEAWAKSVATNDASVVKRILADDFIWVLDGRLVDKKTAVKEAAAGPGSFVSNDLGKFFERIAIRERPDRAGPAIASFEGRDRGASRR